MIGFILSGIFLANASVYTHSSTVVEGEGTTYSKVETTVNGNTTTVESNQPGSVTVEKSDTGETITSDVPVTVTHTQPTIFPTPTLSTFIPPTATPAAVRHITHSSWTVFLHTLWVRFRSWFR